MNSLPENTTYDERKGTSSAQDDQRRKRARMDTEDQDQVDRRQESSRQVGRQTSKQTDSFADQLSQRKKTKRTLEKEAKRTPFVATVRAQNSFRDMKICKPAIFQQPDRMVSGNNKRKA